MQVYSTLQLGEFHPVFCEDFLYSKQIHQDWLVAGVMDGCSSGKDSHFAATLFGKILKKILQEFPYLALKNAKWELEQLSIQQLSHQVLCQFFSLIQTEKNNLFLEIEELVATCLILVYHYPTQKALITVSGDGVVAINDQIIVIEQNDKPDYLAYHLHKTFDQWLTNHTTQYSFEQVTNLAISTDGILSFAKNNTETVYEIDPIRYLMLDTDFSQQDNMLDRKCLYLEQEYGLKPNDDVAIIRLF
ncbi:protein phosphatase 2C domain-containing protein [Aureispira sp. CCB-E]|uniref:protein phosphatase 2C domain-containing protein n=1 Tax=Aureispira sp. CCB-E TaxID=3051121 RepID=UPI002868F360|nr:protein phosphatase 2C domain-containing protein [Aureispira sp. CCB-E]WMX12244.1 protein phosphatase 2C domain-containing protein [Aureispira sp. CCB-E]